jgi:hypothetical protein
VSVSSSDAPAAQQKTVVEAVKKARYAPRFVDGEPVETIGVVLRERIVVRRGNEGAQGCYPWLSPG